MIAQYSPFESLFVRSFLIITTTIICLIYYIKKIALQHGEKEKFDKQSDEINPPKLEQIINIQDKKSNQLIQNQIEDSIKIIRQTRSSKSNNLNDLPWYLMLGPNDSGKTSTILNSDILVSLKDKFTRTPLNKTHPTKLCEWWFSNDAVFIDTEGGFLNSTAEKNWDYLIQSLKSAKPEKPINGIIVCFSITDLIHQSEHEFTNQAWNIKKRLHELSTAFGVKDLPVYVVFSKMDLITGFHEYFENFDKIKLDEVFGMSFPKKNRSYSDTGVDLFKTEFDLIINTLRQMRFGLLQAERSELKRGFILEFPEELMSLKEKFFAFLSEIFSKNRYEEGSFLRGVYFTSSGSIGMPIDPLGMTSEFPYSFQIDPFQNNSHIGKNSCGYFIKNIFTNVIIPDRNISSINVNFKKKNYIYRKLAYSISFIAVILFTILWSTSYFSNKNYLVSLDNEISVYSPNFFANALKATAPGNLSEKSIMDMLQGLQELSALPGGFDDNNIDNPNINFPMTYLGLFQGDKLTHIAERQYLQSLSDYFVPYLKNVLENQLSNNSGNLLDLYKVLETYLMLDDQNHLKDNTNTVLSWFNIYWTNKFESNPNQEKILELLVKNLQVVLSENLYKYKVNSTLIEQSRIALKQLSDEDYIYANITRSHLILPDFKLSSIDAEQAKKVFERINGEPLNKTISNIYTYLGYNTIFLLDSSKYFAKNAFDQKNWILGEQDHIVTPIEALAIKKRIYSKVKQLYLNDYQKQWQDFINTIQLKKIMNLQDAILVTGILANQDSPIKSILKAIENNTTLEPKATNTAAKDSLFSKFNPNQIADENSVDVAFYNLNQLSKKTDGSDKSQLEDVTSLFAEIHAALLNLQQAGTSSSAEIPNELATKIMTLAGQTPAPVNSWLNSLNLDAGNISKKQALKNLNIQWQKIRPQCLAAIQNKYPFCVHCKNPVSASDFSKFFGNSGTLDNFLKANLGQYAMTTSYPWQWKVESNKITHGLKQLEQTSRIRDSFFAPGTQNLKINFTLKPTFLDSDVLTENFATAGLSFNYSHGPIRPVQFSWPNDKGEMNTTISFLTKDTDEPITENYSGFWSLFTMLQKHPPSNNPNSGSPNFSLSIQGLHASFDIYPTEGGNNPFSNPSVFNFRCPDNI